MDIVEVKSYIDDCHAEGKTRLETVTLVSTLPINGESVEAFEYIDLVYQVDQTFNLTDIGNAERLMSQHGSNIRFCYDRNRWLFWRGTHWAWDNGDEIMRLAQKTVRTIYEEAAREEDKDTRKKLAEWAKTSESNSRVNAMVAQAQPLAAIRLDKLDADYWLLNCQNGTVNLHTGQLQSHNKLDYQTILCPTEYQVDMPTPLWDSFLLRTCKDNAELVGYLQRAMGYCLTGDTREQILFFIHGPGQNGKTTFLETFSEILGAYGTQANIEMFLSQYKPSTSGHSEDIANLAGKRLIIASEIEDGRRLATAKLKQMTGGEKIRASHKYEREFEYQVTYKIWLNGNHKPDILDTTYSIWRRVKLILLDVIIPPKERDRKLREKLRAEYPGILAWAVKGCLEWQKNGLDDPLAVRNAVEDYRHEQDPLADFFLDKCFLNQYDAECVVAHKDLFTAYQQWCSNNSIDPVSTRVFARRLKEKQDIQPFTSHGQKKWRYIRLLKDDEVPQVDESLRVDEVDKVDKLPETLHTRGIIPESLGKSSPSSTREAKFDLFSSTQQPQKQYNSRLEGRSSTQKTIDNSEKLENSENSDDNSDLPDCPICDENQWEFTPDGKLRCQQCGNVLEL